MRWRRRPSSSPTRAGSAASAGPTRCACRRASTAPSPQPGHVMPIGEWLKRGYVPAYGRKLTRRRAEERGVAAAAGGHLRPGVPDAEELLRHQGLQLLRPLRAVRRPSQRPHRWTRGRSRRRGARTRSFAPQQVEAMQRTLTARGLYSDKIDGKAGMLTRAALGAYQKANGLKLDCWPTAEVLTHMQRGKMKTRRRLSRPPGHNSDRQRAGCRSASRAEEPRTAPADHVAVRIAHRTARPVAAGAAIGRRCAIRIRLVAGDRIIGLRIGVGRTASAIAPPMMAPAARPPTTPRPTPQPRQRASAVVGARVATANTALAAIARSIFFMSDLQDATGPTPIAGQTGLGPNRARPNKACPICRKFGGATKHTTAVILQCKITAGVRM